MGSVEEALKDAPAQLKSWFALGRVLCEDARLLEVKLCLNSVFGGEAGQQFLDSLREKARLPLSGVAEANLLHQPQSYLPHLLKEVALKKGKSPIFSQ